MPSTYATSYGLMDNPFSPKRPLPGVSAMMMKGIYINPLRLDEDDRLLPLYAADAGPFGRIYREYESKLINEGYVEGGNGVAPSAGINSFIFLLHGPIGTGKTTLMNLMVRLLKRCKPDGGDWMPFKAQFGLSPSDAEQKRQLEIIKERIERSVQGGEYCYLILDNLIDGAAYSAFDLYKYFEDKCQLFMFITTSDARLRQNTWANWPLPIIPYEMTELSPDNAAAYVKRRVELFRELRAAGPLQNHDLFPFNEANIREAVKAQSVAYDAGTKIITLRQFNQALSSILERWLPSCAELFGGAAPPTAAQLADAEIDLIERSREIYEKVAIAA